MTYKHLVNFWPLVPAVDIQAVYETIKSNQKDSENFDLKQADSENETDSDIEILEQNEDSDSEVQFLKSYAIPAITVSEIPYKDYKNVHFKSSNSVSTKNNMNILIMGDDTGSLIKTIARMHRHETDNLNIYIVYQYAESLVRNLLLLSLFHESSLNMDILERAETFLEIFGNTFLPKSTYSFVKNRSASILENIGASKEPHPTIPSVSLKFLKHNEMDEICKILYFLKDSESTYDIKNAWKNSLCFYFGTSYDNRRNLFDYQYNMNLYHYPVIKLLKYREWCETGTAFQLRDAVYAHPNKTLRVHNVDSSSDFFFGDINSSPYLTFGVECGDKAFFKKLNSQYLHTSEDISKFNVIDFFMEFTHKAPQTRKTINVHPLFYPTLFEKNELKNVFDAVYVTRDMTAFVMHRMTADESVLFANMLKKEGIAIFETMKNFVNAPKELKLKFSMNINNLAGISALKLIGTLSDGCFKIFAANC